MRWLRQTDASTGVGPRPVSAKPVRRAHRPLRLAGLVLAAVGLLGISEAGAQQVVFNEIRLRQGSGSSADQIVELKNTGAAAIDVGGWIFCHQFNYQSVIPTGTSIPAGGFLLVHFNQAGTNTSSAVFFPTDELASVSDLALYDRNTFDFTNASRMKSFIQFGGNPGSGRQNVAATAGLWTTNTFVPPVANGHSIELCAANATSVTSFVDQSAPTFGQANGCGVAVQDATWTKLKSIYR